MGSEMYEKINFEDANKELLKEYKQKVGILQRQAREKNIPLMIIFEGIDAAGKGTVINTILQALDPRGFIVYKTLPQTEEEQLHPYMWRHWLRIPSRGRIAIYDRSWYAQLIDEMVKGNAQEKYINKLYGYINSFERQLYNDGTLIIKFFLNISSKEQKKRFQKLQDNSSTSWRVTKEDWKNHRIYNKYKQAYEQTIINTNKEYSNWHIIDSTDRDDSAITVFKKIIDAIETRLILLGEGEAHNNFESEGVKEYNKKFEEKTTNRKSILESLNHETKIEEDEAYKDRIKKCQMRLMELEHIIYKKRIPVIIAYEGWDAAGKGGNIRRLVHNLDPRGYEVVPIAAPTTEEKARNYLWRFWAKMPKDGHITVFDRTWYGRVLVERIEGFCSKNDWVRAYSEINDMESQIADHGAVIIKFWLQIDKDEQLKRFNDRQNNPDKVWKITEEDWRNREKWDEYKTAAEDMIIMTNSEKAPWFVIQSNNKQSARIEVMEKVIESIEKRIYNKRK